jgi:hypothetical protein
LTGHVTSPSASSPPASSSPARWQPLEDGFSQAARDLIVFRIESKKEKTRAMKPGSFDFSVRRMI